MLVGTRFGITLAANQILGQQFAAQSRVFERIRGLRFDQLQRGAELLASDFGFRSAVASGDAPTIESALDSLKRRMTIDEAVVVMPDGRVLGMRDIGRAAEAEILKRAVIDRGATRGVLQLGRFGYRAVATPVMAPDTVGWIVFLTRLTDREMTQLSQLSAMPLVARVRVLHEVPANIPVVATGSFASVERTIHGERMLVQASRVAPFGDGEPHVLILEYSLTHALDAYAPMFFVLFASCALALAAALAGSLFFARKLARPIETLAGAAERVSQGDYASVAVQSSDELGRLAISFNRMVADIAERERTLARTQVEARTRLEARVNEVETDNVRLNAIAQRRRGEALAEAAAALEEGLAPVLAAFDSEADRLAAAARAMRDSLDDARSRALDAGLAAERSERLTRDIANSASDLARSSVGIAADAGATRERVASAATDSVEAATRFAELRDAVEDIGSIAEEIRGVSTRTNTLALNAAIEAARAGEAGLGFAVVANEVKALAGQTAALTMTIGQQLELVAQATLEVDATIDHVGGALAAVGGVTATIATAATDQSHATGTISQGIADIARDSRSAVAAIAQIDGAASRSTAMADQVQESAQDVAARVTVLRGTIDRFLDSLRHAG